jgi:hypothetical protein
MRYASRLVARTRSRALWVDDVVGRSVQPRAGHHTRDGRSGLERSGALRRGESGKTHREVSQPSLLFANL